MSGLLFGSCFGTSTDHDDHMDDGYFQCPTVPYLLPHDVKQKHEAAIAEITAAANNAAEGSHNNDNTNKVGNHNNNSKISDGDGRSSSFLLRGAQHYQRNSARRQEAASRKICRPMLLQGSTLSKHTGSSPGGVRTEPTTDSEYEDEDDDDDSEDEDAEQVEALVNLCVRPCDAEGCDAVPFEDDDDDDDRAAAFGLTKDSSGGFAAALLPPHLRSSKRRSFPLYQELQQKQQGHALWNQHPDIKFLPIHDEDGDPLPSTICVYRPKRAWPEGDVRIRWALSRNTSPTTALVLERWTAAVVLSPPPSATTTTTTSSPDTSDSKDELPTRMLTLEDIDYTTARLDGTVEIHDESSCTTQETNHGASSTSTSSAATPDDTRREIAWLTCYRIVFHDDHDDTNSDNNSNHRKFKKHGRGATKAAAAAAAAAGTSTLIPSPNGTAGFSARKLETRNFFSQFDDARHGPLKQYIREQEEREAHEHHHKDQDDSLSSSREACASPNTTGSIAQSRTKSHDPSTAASSTSRGGGGGCFGRRSKSQQYFVVQNLSVHDDYRGLGIGLCLLDDACRRICDPEAWVLLSIPSSSSTLAGTLPKTRKARFRNLLSSAASIGSSKKSTRSEKREAAAAAAAAASSSSRTVSTVPTNSNPETLMDYLGLLGFERLDGSPFCVRWNETESLPRIEEVCPHVPVFCPPPESC